MLFYNHKHEFVGIDEDGLKLLNYESLEELLEVCADVADLFAKEPGYIHNFKHFKWIDFLLHADSDASSAIVHGNGRTFSCTLQVHKLYLCEEPALNGYMIEMLHVQSMSGEEIKPHHITPPAAKAAVPKTEEAASVFAVPEAAAEAVSPFKETAEREPVPSVLPDYGYLTPTALSEPGTFDVPAYAEAEPAPTPAEEVSEKLTLPEFETAVPEEVPLPAAVPAVPKTSAAGLRFTPAEQAFIDELKVDKSYVFDPSIAANELGLPVDLIQEFIGDFIQQAHDFKADLFDAAMRGDMSNLKILSHKLKGVAANLRIEDAFECLAIINTSEDVIQIEANLKYFYAIINKLEGKEPAAPESETPFAEPAEAELTEPAGAPLPPQAPESVELDEDIYSFAIKEEPSEAPSAYEEPAADYSVGLKHGDDESLIVHEDQLAAAVFEEEFVEPAFEDTFPPSQEEPDHWKEEPYPEPAFESVVNLEELAEPSFEEAPHEPLHYDRGAVAAQLGIEQSFLDELLEDYRNEALASGRSISEAIGAFDTHRWKQASAQLKGISDNLRLNEISEELAILSQTNDAQEANKASKRLNGYLEQL